MTQLQIDIAEEFARGDDADQHEPDQFSVMEEMTEAAFTKAVADLAEIGCPREWMIEALDRELAKITERRERERTEMLATVDPKDIPF